MDLPPYHARPVEKERHRVVRRQRLQGELALLRQVQPDAARYEEIQRIIDRAKAALNATNGTLTGVAAVDRDFVHALFGNFPYVLAFVLVLTLQAVIACILLTRAFRSVVLPIKAVLLNLCPCWKMKTTIPNAAASETALR
jgi:uncharacterized membrane protein YdfJ with MMPL/SSD domain